MSMKKMLEAWQGKSVEELLREEYVDNDLSIRDISAKYHLGLGTVYNWIVEYGLHKFHEPWTAKLSKGEIEEIIKMKGE